MITKLLFLFLCSLSISCQTSNSCGEDWISQQQLVNLSQDCFLKRYDPSKHNGSKLSKIINDRLMTYKNLLHRIKMDQIQHTKTTPVVKWAQSNEKIFINFKLSHRHDSPPCSNINFEKFNSTNIPFLKGEFEISKQFNPEDNSSHFSFASQCYFTDQKFLFTFSMRFNSTLSKITIEKQGFGQYTVIGEKTIPDIWIDPFEDVNRAAIWTQFRNKYSKEMDTYFEMRQKRLEEKESKKPKKRRRRPKSKEKQQPQQVKQEQQNQQQKDDL